MKYGKLLLSFVAVGILTGCGSSGKTLKCTLDNQVSGMDSKTTVEAKFKSDKLDSMTVDVDITVPDEYKDQKKTLMDALSQTGEGIKVTETKEGIKITADSNSEYYKNLNLGDDKAKYSDAKKALESQGYKCK